MQPNTDPVTQKKFSRNSFTFALNVFCLFFNTNYDGYFLLEPWPFITRRRSGASLRSKSQVYCPCVNGTEVQKVKIWWVQRGPHSGVMWWYPDIPKVTELLFYPILAKVVLKIRSKQITIEHSFINYSYNYICRPCVVVILLTFRTY